VSRSISPYFGVSIQAITFKKLVETLLRLALKSTRFALSERKIRTMGQLLLIFFVISRKLSFVRRGLKAQKCVESSIRIKSEKFHF